VYDTLAAKNLPQPANVVAAAAWKENTLVLEGTRFADVVAMLEDDYGYKVVVADTSLLNRKLRGNVPMKEVNNLFFIIEQILDVNVEQQNDTLRITSR
jgi:ferric-dicitrate binding protein FerR (iron transport regulator)